MVRVNKVLPIVFLAALLNSPAGLATIVTDIVFIVDETASLGNVHQRIRDNIGAFAQVLSDGGVDARFGLVGYGSAEVPIRTVTDLTSAGAFSVAAQGLVSNGAFEQVEGAIAYALNNTIVFDSNADSRFSNYTSPEPLSAGLSYRANAIKNLIVVTDDVASGVQAYVDSVDFANALFFGGPVLPELIAQSGALLNAVIDIGDSGYWLPKVQPYGGDVFDIAELISNEPDVVDAFVTRFSNAKLQEILEFCQANPDDPACITSAVPEPVTAALLVIGLFGTAYGRRRRPHPLVAG